MEIRLLGSVELWHGGQPVPLGPRQHRCVLAVLAMTPGQPVPTELLVDRVWGEDPPRNVRTSVYTAISRLRAVLDRAGGAVRRCPGGYLLAVEPDQVDLHRVRRLVAEARTLLSEQPDRIPLALAPLRAAEAGWRGTPLADLRGDWAERVRHALTQEWLAVAAERYELELRLGRHTAVVGRLSELHADHPYAEPLAGLLMRVLSRAGNPAEALRVYGRTRARLADELGVEPGRALQDLHQRLVRGEPAAGPSSAAGASLAATAPPAQLPADVAGFSGRAREQRFLDRLLAGGARPAGTRIVVLDGCGGVGKTALAVHWAHRVAEQFPDGQLYVNLRGFASDTTPLDPGEAVRGFLDALQVPAEQVPATVAAQIGQYRSRLAGRRMLVLLDNAGSAQQVRPLLPGAPGCLVLVTSRDQLSGLVVTEGARPLTLDLLPDEDARRLLAGRLSRERVAAEPVPVQEIVDRCAGLPLALAIVAARAAAHPDFPLATVATQLRVASGGLDAFDAGDPDTDLRTVFSWSYHRLDPDPARLFRLLGVHPGPDLTAAAAASLAGVPAGDARRLLAGLARAHLVGEPTPGRYACHDLLRAYAGELGRRVDPEPDRQAARHRLLDHYLRTAHAAAALLMPNRRPLALPPPRPGVDPEAIIDEYQAQNWFIAEQPVLLAAVALAAERRLDAHAWQLAWAIEDAFDRRGRWRELAMIQARALRAATRLGDRPGQAHSHRGLARAYMRLGRHAEAYAQLQPALRLYRELGDQLGQAHTTHNLAAVRAAQGRHREAIGYARRAVDLFAACRHPAGRAIALNSIGWCAAQLGDHQQALATCRQALAVQQQIGDRRGQAGSWHSLGYAHCRLGQYPEATSCYRHALAIHRALDNRYFVARTLVDLGDVHQAAGRPGAARRDWHRALDLLRELDHPDAAEVRDRLGGRDAPAAT